MKKRSVLTTFFLCFYWLSLFTLAQPNNIQSKSNNQKKDNIAASLRQQADVRTYNLTDEQISTAIGNSLYGNSENENSQGLIAEYNKLIASGKTDKKTVAMMSDLENEIEERESLLGEAGIESSEELINKRRNYMKNDVISQEINRERGAAYAKYVRNNVYFKTAKNFKQKIKEFYDKTWNDIKSTMRGRINDNFQHLNFDTLN